VLFKITFAIKYDENVSKAVIRAIFSKLEILKVDLNVYITIVKQPKTLPVIPNNFTLGCNISPSLLIIDSLLLHF